MCAFVTSAPTVNTNGLYHQRADRDASLPGQEDITFEILESKTTEVLHQQYLVPGDLALAQLSTQKGEQGSEERDIRNLQPHYWMQQVSGCVGRRTLKRHIGPEYAPCYCALVTLVRAPTRSMRRLHAKTILQEGH